MRVAFVGLGPTGRRILFALLDAGATHVALADTRPVLASDVFDCPSFARSGVGKPRDASLAAALAARHPDVHIEVVSEPGHAANNAPIPPSWLSGFDICLLATELPWRQTALALNAACVAARVPLVPALVMGDVGQVGPVVRANGSACLQCADIRLSAATGSPCLHTSLPPPGRAVVTAVAAAAAVVCEEILAHGAHHDTGVAHVEFITGNGARRRHPVLRTRHCSACVDADPALPFRAPAAIDLGSSRPADRARILALRDLLVDAATGPIISLEQRPVEGEGGIEHWTSQLVDAGWFAQGAGVVSCGGHSLARHEAIAAALGEAIERAAAASPRAGNHLRSRYKDVRADAIDPLAWDLFGASARSTPGFPYSAPSRNREIDWVWGFSLTQSRPVLVPAAHVFAAYQPADPAEEVDVRLVSGFATGASAVDAVVSGLLEVIERDAFMIAWANQLALRRVDVSATSTGDIGAYCTTLASRGLDVRCGIIELDLGAPLAIATGTSRTRGEPAVVIATAADTSAEAACRGALKELGTNHQYVRHLMAEHSAAARSPSDAGLEEGNGLLYARADVAARLEFWWSAEHGPLPLQPAAAGSAADKLNALLAAIEAAGLEAIAVDLTDPEIKKLGLWTVKVLVPGTYPMNFDSRWPHFGGDRILRAPVNSGLLDAPSTVDQLERYPHPFP